MLFRIEDSENPDGHHREYEIPYKDLPKLKLLELENYIADEIRKEINNTLDRNLLSYSKSLGVCLLKYNKFADNELHININDMNNFVCFSSLKDQNMVCVQFNLSNGLYGLESKDKEREIILQNFQVDVSDNNLLNNYLLMATGTGRKKMASPEKDKEVLLMQSPNDIVISAYSEPVYLLYALSLKFGMKKSIYENLVNKICTLENFRFQFCGESERYGLIQIIEYLYRFGRYEKEMSQRILQDSLVAENVPVYYDLISQLHGIQEDSFEDSYMLSDYNKNKVSDCIWDCYSQEYL
ncbi:hypothetical protein [Clostridium diolis]|uniref:hypothetical protein n=1 Tax=Clostridium diolis TaxID=223919 RepID=UPI003AF9713E